MSHFRVATRRLPLALTIILVVAGLALIVVLGLAGAFIWGMSGGWDGLRRQAQPDDRPVISARAAGQAPLEHASSSTRAALTSTLGPPVAVGMSDGCTPGQNNWKIQDGYTLRCEAATLTTYALPAEGLDAPTASALTRAFEADGRADHSALEAVAADRSESALYARGRQSLRVSVEPGGAEGLFLTYPGQFDSEPEGPVEVVDVKEAIASSSTPTVTIVLSNTYFED